MPGPSASLGFSLRLRMAYRLPKFARQPEPIATCLGTFGGAIQGHYTAV